MFVVQILEAGGFLVEVQLCFSDGPVSVLGNQYVGDIFIFRIFIDSVFPVDEQHHVSILFDRAALSEV